MKQVVDVDSLARVTESLMSRRAAVGSAGVALVGLLSGTALGQEKKAAEGAGRTSGAEMMEQFKAMSERMRNAGPEERMKIMAEQRELQRRQAIDEFKNTLGISDADWPVLRPRIEAVYNLVHPLPPIRGNIGGQPRTEVDQRSAELRAVLRDENAPADGIKARLAALRSAKEKARKELATARQNLRQVMSLRREAQLVLAGLLD